MTILVGEVVAVEGTKITIRIFEESNRDTLFLHGQKYKGVSIREYLSIQRGFRDIVCLVLGEYLDERRLEGDGSSSYFVRRVEVKPIGYLEEGRFREGIKFLPMIKDSAFLMQESAVKALYTTKGESKGLAIGQLLKEEIPIAISWQRLFNTHIGIFGNTGSGKSNTLTKLYTALFEAKANDFAGKSKFVLLDFNGEYTNNQLIGADQKRVIHLRTNVNGGDKIAISKDEFWHTETLSILFQATTNTQRPFINRVVTNRAKHLEQQNSLARFFAYTCKTVFSSAAPKTECLDMLRVVCKLIQAEELQTFLGTVKWHSQQNKFFVAGPRFFDSDGNGYANLMQVLVNSTNIGDISAFDEFLIRAHLQLTLDVLSGFVQFEHIQPLLKRSESAFTNLRRVVDISDDLPEARILTVISLRNCNQDTKKVLPLLVAKHYYNSHRSSIASPPDRTMHLIIDEAHNILSEQSSREHEVWRDYRLELFEEIIKEGRKFGMFLTLSSQRPADISPTIVSQLHNFFIHRLVNERDLYLIDNTISTLDQVSKAQIPNLSKGCCIVTGTSFDLPMTLQVDLLERNKQPDSEDVDLAEIWSEHIDAPI
jgi:DNA helicase HerA-like ATPase